MVLAPLRVLLSGVPLEFILDFSHFEDIVKMKQNLLLLLLPPSNAGYIPYRR